MVLEEGVSGEFLLTVATVLSIQIAKGRTAQEVGLLGALFTVLGDQLALLALKIPGNEISTDQET